MNAIIVDDEESARDVLEALLEMNHSDVNIVDKCHDVDAAIQAIQKHSPDLVFLDIEMPGGTGFEVLKRLDTPVNFEVIFVTAYDKYAIKAFEVSAIDYLLKPVEEDRLEQAVDKVRSNIASNDMKDRLATLTQTLESKTVQKITVYHKGERYLVPVTDIVAIQAQGAYCTIFIQGDVKELIISKNLKQVENMLDENERFFRSHRSWVVNMDKLISYSKQNGTITLENSIVAKLSEYKLEAFERQFSD